MTAGASTNLPTGGGCTCTTCPVHSKPPCQACGSRGAHYCPGPSAPVSPYKPYWYSQPSAPYTINVSTAHHG